MRHRVKLGRPRKDIKNRVWSVLNRRRIRVEDLGVSSPFTQMGRHVLRDLGISELDDHLDLLGAVEERIRRVEDENRLGGFSEQGGGAVNHHPRRRSLFRPVDLRGDR